GRRRAHAGHSASQKLFGIRTQILCQRRRLEDRELDMSEDGTMSEDSTFNDSAAVEAEQLRTDLHEASDRLLRAQAELENYRKRARRELEDERRYANMPLLRDLLPV